MRKLNLQDIQSGCLDLLVVLDSVCDELDLRYSLSGGTLLGAIRHKGFIPWDDDADVNMPRQDFDTLRAISDELFEGTDYYLRSYPADSDDPMFLKLCTKRIYVNELYSDGLSNLWLDIFPVDGMPDDDREVERLCRRALRYRKIAIVNTADASKGKTVFRRYVKTVSQPVIRNFGLGSSCASRLVKLARRIPYGSTGSVGVIVWGYGVGERVVGDAFDNLVDVSFAGRSFKAMNCWDQYLTGLYGEYMVLPPEGDRKQHDMQAWIEDEGR